jgi:hypothetical protein
MDPGAWERVGYLMDHEAERREEVDYWHMFQVKFIPFELSVYVCIVYRIMN